MFGILFAGFRFSYVNLNYLREQMLAYTQLLPLITENTENRGLCISAEYFIEQDLPINSLIIKKRSGQSGQEIVSYYKMFCIMWARYTDC